MTKFKQDKKLPDVILHTRGMNRDAVITRRNKERDAKLINPLEYTNRSYEELSAEFKLSLSRAVDLVPLMYNRLTLVDKLSHKAAITRMYNDHRHLPRFSQRSIRRYLPLSNKEVPRRVRPLWPKNRSNETHPSEKLSRTKQPDTYIEKLSENAEVWTHVGGLEDEVKWLKKLLALEPSDRPSFKKSTTLSVVRRAGGVPVLIAA